MPRLKAPIPPPATLDDIRLAADATRWELLQEVVLKGEFEATQLWRSRSEAPHFADRTRRPVTRLIVSPGPRSSSAGVLRVEL